MVALRGRNFPILREVKTESWLRIDYHLRGWGTEARAALLHLAFDGLGADAALSEVSKTTPVRKGSLVASATDTTAFHEM